MTAEDQFICIGVSMLAALGATFVIFAITKTIPVIYEKIKSRKDSIKRKFQKQKDEDQSLQALPDSKVPIASNKSKKNEGVENLKVEPNVSPLKDKNWKAKQPKPLLKVQNPEKLSIKGKFEKQEDEDKSLQSLPDFKDSFEVDVIPADCNDMEFFQIMTPVYIRMPLASHDKEGNLQALPKKEMKWKLKESDKIVNLEASSEDSPLKDRNGKTKKSRETFRPILKSSNPEESSEHELEVVGQRKLKHNNMNATHLPNKTSSSSSSSSSSMDTSSSDSDENDEKKLVASIKSKKSNEVENHKVPSVEDKNGKAKQSNPLLLGHNPENSSESERVVRQKSSKSTKTKTTSINASKSLSSPDLIQNLKIKEPETKLSKKAKETNKRRTSVTKNDVLAGKSSPKSLRKGNQSKKEKVQLKNSCAASDNSDKAEAIKPLIKRESVSEHVDHSMETRGKSKSKLSNNASKKSVKIQNKTTSNSKDSKVELKANVKTDSNDSVHKNVETIVTVEKHSGNENILDIDLDMSVDPKTKKSMKLHTHAEVDKQKMNLHGKAESKEGEGKAQISGFISHKGTSDIGTMELDVIEDSQDSDEIEIEAKANKKEEKDLN